MEGRDENRERARVALLAFVEVADGRDDVETAHSVCGESDHDEREQDAEADRDDEAGPLDMKRQRDAFVEAAEDAREHADHQRGHADPQDGPDDARSERVSGAFEHEHLGQMPALEADGPAHPHLRAALGGEHHEDEKDQQDSYCNGKEAHAEQRAGDEETTGLGERDRIGLVRRVRVQVEPADEAADAAAASPITRSTNLFPARALNSSVTAGWSSSTSRRRLRSWAGSRKLAWAWIFRICALIAGVFR